MPYIPDVWLSAVVLSSPVSCVVVIAPFSSMRVLSSLNTTDLRGLRSGMGCSYNTAHVSRLLIVAKTVEIARNVQRGMFARDLPRQP